MMRLRMLLTATTHRPYLEAFHSSKKAMKTSILLLIVAGGLYIFNLHICDRIAALEQEIKLAQSSQARLTSVAAQEPIFRLDVPLMSQYFADVGILQKTVSDAALPVVGIEYRHESTAKLPTQVRVISIRATDDYLHIKRFLSLLLQRISNAALKEFRLDRIDGTGNLCNATLSFAFLYKKAILPTDASVSRDMSSQSSTDSMHTDGDSL